MKSAIMQPTYLPWSGYFNLIKNVDLFVFLDDVQFERRSWQSRNRILTNGSVHTLSVPIKKQSQFSNIDETLIHQSFDWQSNHFKTIQMAYKKAKFGDELIQLLKPIYTENQFSKLITLNQTVIRHICNALRINTKFILSSELPLSGKKTDYLISICKHIGCTQYLSPRGSAEYLKADGFSVRSEINLLFQSFTPATYKQLKSELFHTNLSIVDVIAHIGVKETMNYVK